MRAGRMTTAETNGDRRGVGEDVGYLRTLVDQLRTELEERAALLASERQQWMIDRETDRSEARRAVDAMRVELEAAVLERNAAVQEATASAAAEVEQLRGTVEELRRLLVEVHEEAASARRSLERGFRDEREQLQSTIGVLRARLEANDDH